MENMLPTKGSLKLSIHYTLYIYILYISIIAYSFRKHLNFYKNSFSIFSRNIKSKNRLRKGRGTRDQIANICWIMEKGRQFQKNIYFCFIDYAKAFDGVDHNKLWKVLKETGIPDHCTSLMRNVYAGQEATVRTGHGTTDWFQIGKGVRQGCILSPCLFNFYVEQVMRNTGMDEA